MFVNIQFAGTTLAGKAQPLEALRKIPTPALLPISVPNNRLFPSSDHTGMPMSSLLVALFALVASSFRTHAALQAEILALRHQLAVFQKNAPGRAPAALRPVLMGSAVSILVGLAPMPTDGST